jgi:Peptidase_C39 like family
MLNFPDPRTTRRTFLIGAGACALGQRHFSKVEAGALEIIVPEPVRDPDSYTVYIPAACKNGQFHHYTCEFDAAWAVLKTFGIDAGLEEQFAAIEIDDRIEPYYEETTDGFIIHGGDIGRAWSGDYHSNFLARCTASAIRNVFKQYGLFTGRVRSRRGIERSLNAGRLVWIKTTVDFHDWVPATWVSPEGNMYSTVLGNDHAMVVMGYDDDVVLLRDVLGPTDTNWDRQFEYEIDWQTFMRCWEAQNKDGLAVGLPAVE